MFGIVINQEGYKVEFVHVFEDETIDSYELKENEQLITTDWSIANSMNQPRWTGTEWIDENPLPEPEPVVPEMTLEERLIQLETMYVNDKTAQIEKEILGGAI